MLASDSERMRLIAPPAHPILLLAALGARTHSAVYNPSCTTGMAATLETILNSGTAEPLADPFAAPLVIDVSATVAIGMEERKRVFVCLCCKWCWWLMVVVVVQWSVVSVKGWEGCCECVGLYLFMDLAFCCFGFCFCLCFSLHTHKHTLQRVWSLRERCVGCKLDDSPREREIGLRK